MYYYTLETKKVKNIKIQTNTHYIMNAKARLKNSLIINPKRTLMLNGEFGEKEADGLVARILELEQEDVRKNIYFQFNSKGGSYVGGMKIYDAIKNCRPRVIGIVTGDAFSMTGVVLQACDYRAATKHSRILFHNVSLSLNLKIQPESEVEDFTAQIKNEIDDVIQKNENIKQIVAAKGAKDIGDIDIFLRAERVLPASRALLLGFIDEII